MRASLAAALIALACPGFLLAQGSDPAADPTQRDRARSAPSSGGGIGISFEALVDGLTPTHLREASVEASAEVQRTIARTVDDAGTLEAIGDRADLAEVRLRLSMPTQRNDDTPDIALVRNAKIYHDVLRRALRLEDPYRILKPLSDVLGREGAVVEVSEGGVHARIEWKAGILSVDITRAGASPARLGEPSRAPARAYGTTWNRQKFGASTPFAT